MNSQCRLEPLGTYGVPPKRYKVKKFRRGPQGEIYRAQFREHQPMMYLTTTNSEGKKKTSFVEQRIELTTAINKGKVYPYASAKRLASA